MNRIFSASYQFTFGEIDFQIDLDETLSAKQKLQEFSASTHKALHEHPFFEIFFVFDDEIEIVFEQGTRKFQNCVVCLPPKTKHYTIRSSDYRVLLSHSHINHPRGRFASFISNFFSWEKVSHFPMTCLTLKAYLEELCQVFYNQTNALDEEAISSILRCILYKMFSLYHASSETVTDTNHFTNESRYVTISSLVARCTTRGNDVTISTIADALCLSQKQASRLVRKYYGKSLAEVVTQEKLIYAAYLLKNTRISVYDVAFESNFNSYSYFCRCFKKEFGCMPLHYRKGI